MKITLFNTIASKDKSAVVEKLITHSTPSQDFYLMIILAISMATLGLLLNNTAIVIGSMLISPILYAFLSLSLGFSISDPKLMIRSFGSIFKATVVGIVVATFITLFMDHEGLTKEILIRVDASIPYAMVAFIAGFAASFTMTKPQLNETIPGIAIAVSLIPPIAISGIGLAILDWEVVRGSLSVLFINTVAILGGSLIVFLLMNIYAKKGLAEITLKEEDK